MDIIKDSQAISKDRESTPNPYLETPQRVQEERVQSSQKMKYSAEVTLIKRTHGDLEGIRSKIGLSQRKMCQLLMVDPSAWTRWTKSENEAPPHIYRALQWFLLLQEKDPNAGTPYSWLQSVARPSLPRSEIKALESELRETLFRDSRSHIESSEKKIKWLISLNIVLATISVMLLASHFLRLSN